MKKQDDYCTKIELGLWNDVSDEFPEDLQWEVRKAFHSFGNVGWLIYMLRHWSTSWGDVSKWITTATRPLTLTSRYGCAHFMLQMPGTDNLLAYQRIQVFYSWWALYRFCVLELNGITSISSCTWGLLGSRSPQENVWSTASNSSFRYQRQVWDWLVRIPKAHRRMKI